MYLKEPHMKTLILALIFILSGCASIPQACYVAKVTKTAADISMDETFCDGISRSVRIHAACMANRGYAVEACGS